MQGKISKWGNSAAVRIPATVLAAVHVAIDQTVEIREEAGRIVIEPVPLPTFDIEHLIAAITDDNRHALADVDPPLGNEHW